MGCTLCMWELTAHGGRGEQGPQTWPWDVLGRRLSSGPPGGQATTGGLWGPPGKGQGGDRRGPGVIQLTDQAGLWQKHSLSRACRTGTRTGHTWGDLRRSPLPLVRPSSGGFGRRRQASMVPPPGQALGGQHPAQALDPLTPAQELGGLGAWPTVPGGRPSRPAWPSLGGLQGERTSLALVSPLGPKPAAEGGVGEHPAGASPTPGVPSLYHALVSTGRWV